MNVDFGNKLKSIRKKLNLTQNDVAKVLNKNRNAICRLERGDIKSIKFEHIKPLCKILNITYDEFFDMYLGE